MVGCAVSYFFQELDSLAYHNLLFLQSCGQLRENQILNSDKVYMI